MLHPQNPITVTATAILFFLFLIVAPTPATAASGENAGIVVTQLNFLETPAYVIAIIFAFFLFVSLLFEKVVALLIHYFRRKKRFGLVASINSLVMELTLVGFVSLLLTAIEEPIAKACVPYDSGDFHGWTLLSNVAGCNCCLQHTSGVSTCAQKDRSCGYEFCNCGYPAEPDCPMSQPNLGEALGTLYDNSNCTCDATYSYQVKEVLGTAKELLTAHCDGPVPTDVACPEGQTHLISPTTLHQVHIFIFVMALTHVFLSILMILVASWRINLWKRWKEDDSDEYSKAARQSIAESSSHHTKSKTRRFSKMGSLLKNKMQKASKIFPHLNRPSVMPKSSSGLSDAVNGGEGSKKQQQQQGDLESQVAAMGANVNNNNNSTLDALKETSPMSNSPKASTSSDTSTEQQQNAPKTSSLGFKLAAQKALAVSKQQQQQQPSSTDNGVEKPFPTDFTTEPSDGDVCIDFSGDEPVGARIAQEARKEQIERIDFGDIALAAAMLEDNETDSVENQGRSVQRLTTFTQKQVNNNPLKEYLICFFQQLWPQAVTREEFNIMRASFIITHRVPPTFDFMEYILNSMEDDLSKVVGISVEMWLTLVLFILISGVLGWAMLIFLCIVAVIHIIINTKLMSIIRHVCKDGTVAKLASNVFWFKRPPLLLPPIKFVLFLCSFTNASTIFFIWMFGTKSCFTSNAFWFSWNAPWWISLIVSWYIFFDMAFKTIPMYSLAVQMGSDFKHSMLPSGLKRRLLQIAAHAKETVAQQKRAAAEEDGSLHGGGKKSVFNKMQQYVNEKVDKMGN